LTAAETAPAPSRMGAVTRVLVVAGSAVVRAGLEALVASSPALSVVGSVSGVAALGRAVASLQPHVVLLELEPHEDDPAPALLALAASPPSASTTPAVVVLADDPRGEWAVEALRSGVRAMLPREATAAEIVAAVDAAAAGLVVLHPSAVGLLLPLLPTPVRAVTPVASNAALTPREVEVLGMLAEGLGNKIIARRLGISEHTVKFHVGSIFGKLGASSRTEAVTLGARQGLIML